MTIQNFEIDSHCFGCYEGALQPQQTPLYPVVRIVQDTAHPVLTEQVQEASRLRDYTAVLIAGTAGEVSAIALSTLCVVGKILPPPYNVLLGGVVVLGAHFIGGEVYHRVYGRITGSNGG